MSENLQNELNNFVDGIVDVYSERENATYVIKSFPYLEILHAFSSIVISYEDRALECLYASDNFDDFACSLIGHLGEPDDATLEDMNDALLGCVRNYYKSKFDCVLAERLAYKYQLDQEEAGKINYLDKDTGETCYA